MDAQTHVLAPQSTGVQPKSVRTAPTASASSSSSSTAASSDSSSKHGCISSQAGVDDIYSSYHDTASRAYEAIIAKELEHSVEHRDCNEVEGIGQSVSSGSGSSSESHALSGRLDEPHPADVAAALAEVIDRVVRDCEVEPNEGGGDGEARYAPTAAAIVHAKYDAALDADSPPGLGLGLELEPSTVVPTLHNSLPQPLAPAPSPSAGLMNQIAGERRAGQLVCLDYLYLTLECGLSSSERTSTSTAFSTSTSTSWGRGRPTCSDGSGIDGGQIESCSPVSGGVDCSDAEGQGSLLPSHASSYRAEAQLGVGVGANALNRRTLIATVGWSFPHTESSSSSSSRVTQLKSNGEKPVSVQKLEEKLEKNLKSSKKRKKEKSGSVEKGKENQSRSPEYTASGSPCPRKVPRESIGGGSPIIRLPLSPKPPSPSPPSPSHTYIPAYTIEKYSMFNKICSFYEEDRKQKRIEGDPPDTYLVTSPPLFCSLLLCLLFALPLHCPCSIQWSIPINLHSPLLFCLPLDIFFTLMKLFPSPVPFSSLLFSSPLFVSRPVPSLSAY